MIYIDGIGYVDERSYSAARKLKEKTDNTEFDSILTKEKIIYSTPENVTGANGTQKSNGQAVTSPQELEAYFEEAAAQFDVSLNLLKAVAKQESDFNPTVVSTAGATGIMQLMPDTAAELGVTDSYDPRQNIIGGARLLSSLLMQYGGDVSLALAAYNAGPGNVEKYNGIPPFSETQEYVRKVMEYAGMELDIPETVYARREDEDADVVNRVYAVASQDATVSPKIYTIYSTPDNS